MSIPTTALVLGGGGARAAYQVGVMQALTQFYPRNHGIPFKIICGTSAGAINGTALATHASCFHLGVKKLDWVWQHMQTNKIYRTSIWSQTKHLLKMASRVLQSDQANTDACSLFNNEPLRFLLNEVIDFTRVDRNIMRGSLHALSIDTSCYDQSNAVSFFQAATNVANWQRSKRCGKRCQLNTEHLLASSAIPLVFPSIRLGQHYYGDGALHQLSPLSSPIHLGAEQILVINLDSPHKKTEANQTHHPKAATLTGHLLDALFSETLNSDLERLTRVNNTLDLIDEKDQQKLALRKIKTLVIKPSEDLSLLAAQHFKSFPLGVRTLLKLIGINDKSDSSIISYLLFEQSFTRLLINLGYQDAMNRADELRDFFCISRY